jgi:molybdenum cofactor guanylyltransferase
MAIKRKVTGVILAGGKSSRIGTNKALLKINDKNVIQIIKDTLSSILNDVIIIADQINEYEFLGLSVFRDIYPDKGPLGGIHSGLFNSSTDKNFFVSCDMPFITRDLIKFIIEHKTDKKIVVNKTEDRIQPLCGIYTKECIPVIEEILKDTNSQCYSIHRLLDIISVDIIDLENDYNKYNSNIMFNLNTKEDYNSIKTIF